MPDTKVGLDFGTTYTVLSHIENGEPKAFEPSEGHHATQHSIVSKKEDNWEFGEAARNRLGRTGVTIYTGFKMMLTEKNEDALKKRGYEQNLTPRDITATYLDHIITSYLKDTRKDSIAKLVVGVPEIWVSSPKLLDCRKVLRDIFTENNEKVKDVQIVSEPAAACAHFVDNYKKETGKNFNGRILVVDYGGGTLDIALCDVKQNGNRSEVSVRKQTGAGENQEGLVGKAGLAFMEEVVKLALSKSGLSEEVIVSNREFLPCVYQFEDKVKTSSQEIEFFFSIHKHANMETLDKKFFDIEMNGKEYPISYGMMAETYNKIISPVLKDKITEMITYMDNAGIDHSVNTKDNFKIAMVGGFCNFYLTQHQIEDMFNKGGKDDQRFKDIIRNRRECERAISYGAVLIANEIIGFKQVAPYSLGVANEKEGEKYWAIEIGEDIIPNKPVFIRHLNKKKKRLFSGEKIPMIAFNFTLDKNTADAKEPLEKYSEKLILDKYKIIHLAFSFDESMMITLHKYTVDNIHDPEPNITNRESVQIDDIYKLFGGLIEIGGNRNV